MKIKILPKKTYQKIAAGEVIDRPSSVVRELLDNAIDSEASVVRVMVADGGKKLIQITDNGCGMSKKDLQICYHKHTTSKISDFEDIYRVVSLGFRGEALNAISIISELEITSKTEEDDIGYSVLIREGELQSEREVVRNTGSTVIVRHLFHNIPVRQKSLKSDTAEFRQIKEVFIHKAIPFYDRDFHLTHNGKPVYSSLKSRSPMDRIKLFFGEDLSEHLIEVNQDFDNFHISGFLSSPNFFKPTKKFQSVYINQRPIFSPSISHAIFSAYEGITPVGQHPLAFLFIQIPPQLMDVNIHPTKREVKLLNESAIHQGVYHLIKDA
ncbi:MAG: DNA mismatch repair endonuclease MutL, partial [Spirochaetota bacterium]|nr:DNA mismatch repair endonuclease MutL [Spirochaetota bacterium]